MGLARKIDIRVRFTIFLATTSLAFLVLFSLVVYTQAEKKSYTFAQQSLLELLEHEWEHIDLSKHNVQSRPGTPHFKDVYLRVWKAGVLLYDSFPKGFSESFPPEGKLAKNKLFHQFTKNHNGHQYELQSFYDLTSTTAYLSFLRNILLVSCILAALVLVPVSLLSTIVLLKPFRDLATSTSEVTAEDLAFRFPNVTTKDEYGILTRNFNELLNRLEKSFLQVKRFALNASHELRTPLAVIISQGEMALRRERSAAEYKVTIDKMLTPAKRLREIVNRLLFLAELDRLEQENKIATIDVSTTIDSLTAAIRDTYCDYEKNVAIRNANGSASFVGNREIFDVVVSNLIENAYKFSKEKVNVTYQKKESGLVVIVDDDGPGIPSEHLGVIMEPLARPKISNELPPERRGAGLGLSIVKACIDSVKGSVELAPSKMGGLSVTVLFPQSHLG